MNEMIDSKTDLKNIGLLKNLWELRQALDIYCLISVNAEAIKKAGVGKPFFGFIQMSCHRLIVLYICKIFDEEKSNRRGVVKYELDSIDGVLRSIDNGKMGVLNSDKIAVIEKFRKQYDEPLSRFKTLRDKRIAHGESGFSAKDAPSYDHMERLFDFGHDFYRLVSEEIISVGPTDLNSYRMVKTSLTRMLKQLGCEKIKTEME